MGRRALRKIDPTLDLSRHLKVYDQLPVPLDASELFGRSAPLELEIGSGKGLFLHTASGQLPERDFLGIEIARKYARFAAARLARAARVNALVIHGDAGQLLREGLAENSLAAIHIYFPDPWWKKRHKKRRVMNAEVAAAAQRTLCSGAVLHFWTDVEEYFETALDLIRTHTDLAGPLDAPQASRLSAEYRTHFERRMRLQDRPVYRAAFRR